MREGDEDEGILEGGPDTGRASRPEGAGEGGGDPVGEQPGGAAAAAGRGHEAELEALQGTGKKRNKGGQTNAGRQEELEALNERRKWHISRLEIVLRLLNNGSLAVEKVNELKEDVEYIRHWELGVWLRVDFFLYHLTFFGTGGEL